MVDDLTYLFPQKSIRINSWGYTEKKQCTQNDFYDESLSAEIMNVIELFFLKNYDIEIVKRLNYANLVSLKSITPRNKPIFLFCRVICENKTNGIIRLYSNMHTKVWINQKLVASISFKFEKEIKIPFAKGENIVVLELLQVMKETAIGFWLGNYEYVTNKSAHLYQNNLGMRNNQIDILYKVDNNILEYIAIPNDLISIDKKQKIVFSIYDINSSSYVYSAYSTFYIKQKIDIFNLCNETIATTGCFVIVIHYKTLEDELKKSYIYKMFYMYEKNLCVLKNYMIKILSENSSLTRYDKLGLEYYISSSNIFRPDTEHIFTEMLEAHAMVKKLLKGEHLDTTLYDPGVHRKFYKSNLDEKVFSYTVSIPEKYDCSNSLPLVVIISTTKHPGFPQDLSNYSKEQVVVVSISGRGVMLGSYIAEAAIWEAVLDISNSFNIDAKRIYMIGFSNGASAAWAQAQCYPHLLAGIIPIAGSAYQFSLKNLINMRVIHISSKMDFLYQSQHCIQKKYLLGHKGYKEILYDDIIHPEFSDMPYAVCGLEELMFSKVEDYPNEIYYRTEKNRHLKSFWISLGGIPYGKKYSVVHAKINKQTIYVFLENVSEVTLTLPPQIGKDSFDVIINEKEKFQIRNYKKNNLVFKLVDKHYKINTATEQIDYRKGTGILDVYLGPLVIAITDDTKKELLGLAEKCSRPTTNGMDDVVIAIDYPIIRAEQISKCENEKNFIIIDNNTECFEIGKIRSCCPIKTDKYGFSYKNEVYSGDYLVMQVIPNPNNNKASVLYINCNALSLIRKNIFTRCFIIPSYINGLHTFLNNMALIYYENKYYAIYEWGADLIEIK